jgi:putative ABC transport system permease protein
VNLAQIALRNIGRNRRRSVLSATATAIATMALVAMMAYINGMRVDMQKNVSDFVTGHVRVRHVDYDKLERLNPLHLRVERPDDLVARIDADPAVAASVERLPLPVAIFQADETVGALALGLDPERERAFMDIGKLLRTGRLPRQGENEAVLGVELARKLGLGVGDRLTILSSTMRRSSNALTLDVVGLASFPVAAMDNRYLLMPLDRAQALARMDGGVTEVLVKAKEIGQIGALRARVQTVLEEGAWDGQRAKTWTEASFSLALFAVAEGAWLIFGVVFFLLASTVLVNTTMMVVFERTREIGTVGALGMKPGEIVRMFFLEAVYLATLGAVAGVVLGLAIAVPLGLVGLDISSVTQGMSFDVSNVIHPLPRVDSTLLITVYSIAISSLAALLPARRAAKIQPVEALRAI